MQINISSDSALRGLHFCVYDLHLASTQKHSLFSLAVNIKRKLNKKRRVHIRRDYKLRRKLSIFSSCTLVLCCCFCVSPSFFLKVSIFSDEGENTLWGGFEMSFSSSLRSSTIALQETRNITRSRTTHQSIRK
jgi:hypothetical protein